MAEPDEATTLLSLGLSASRLRQLAALGIDSLEALLSYDPLALRARTALWEELEEALRDLVCEFHLATRVVTFLKTRPPERPRAPQSLPDQVARVLSSEERPITVRYLRDRLRLDFQVTNLVGLDAVLREHEEVIEYPFGHHRWLGLREWGDRGWRQAATAAWVVLPVHLEQLEASEGKLPADAIRILSQLAEEQGDARVLDLLSRVGSTADRVAEAPAPRRQVLAEATDPPRLFEGLHAGTDLSQFAARLLREVALIRAMGILEWPFSLCQLRLSQGDSMMLRLWARLLNRSRIERWSEGNWLTLEGQSCRAREVLGLVFWTLASEVARRDAREGDAWGVVMRCFSEEAQTVLFSQKGPTQLLRWLLEEAAQTFGLRQVFGQEGQAWYKCLFLQFGFTRQGISQLPSWLNSGTQNTVAVQYLRDNSAEFRNLWSALSAYHTRPDPVRHKQLTEVLRASSFVLPDWHESILLQARRARAESPEGQVSAGQAWVRLDWPEGRSPRFLLPLAENLPDLEESGYEVLLDGRSAACLYRLPEGYRAQPEEIELRPTLSEANLTLVGYDSEETRTEVISLWDQESPALYFSLETGRREERPTGRALAVLTSEGIELAAGADERFPLPNGCQLWRLGAGWTREQQLLQDGDPVAASVAERDPAWAQQVTVAPQGDCVLPGEVTLWVAGLPEGCTLRSCRAGQRPLKLVPQNLGFQGVVQVGAELTSARLPVFLSLRYQSRSVRLRRAVDLPVTGVTLHEGGCWSLLRGQESLTVRQLREGVLRFYTGSDPPGEHAVLEGALLAHRPRAGFQSLEGLEGYGAPLTLTRGPYNASHPGTRLVSSLVNQGRVRAMHRKDETFELHFHKHLEGGPEHTLLWWGQEVHRLPASDLEVCEGPVWEGSVPPDGAPMKAVGLSIAGECRGAWWEPLSADDPLPASAAPWLRWFGFPLQDERWKESARELVRAHPVETLTAWLKATGHENLPLRDLSPAWLQAVGELVRGWAPPAESCRELLSRVGCQPLLDVSPFFLYRVVRKAGVDREGVLLELAEAEHFGQLARQADLWLRQAVNEMRVDDRFARLLGEKVRDLFLSDKQPDARQLQNIELACSRPAYRRWMAVQLLTGGRLDGTTASTGPLPPAAREGARVHGERRVPEGPGAPSPGSKPVGGQAGAGRPRVRLVDRRDRPPQTE